ncbi:hypothetical protein BD413DRAFT_611925 [Trametes elegans]|nr:hypothetical protein BD413DRAFT_611925 [Trametes elegans]
MMDAKSLYTSGHHPIRLEYTPETLYPVTALPPVGRSVPYCYIDFGLSTRFSEGQSTLVLGDVGREEAPELSDDTPYDASKVDIWAPGSVYATEFTQKYKIADFLLSPVDRMARRDPQSRPTAEEVMREWEKARATISGSLVLWRLTPNHEQPLERVVDDTFASARAGMYRLQKLVG